MQLNHLATDMQISMSLQERFGKLWLFEGLKTCQNFDTNMEGFC